MASRVSPKGKTEIRPIGRVTLLILDPLLFGGERDGRLKCFQIIESLWQAGQFFLVERIARHDLAKQLVEPDQLSRFQVVPGRVDLHILRRT